MTNSQIVIKMLFSPSLNELHKSFTVSINLRMDCNGNAPTISQNCEEIFSKTYFPKIENDFQSLLKLLHSNFPNHIKNHKKYNNAK
jgi:uncharacterized protein YozE (UPF0346 family)